MSQKSAKRKRKSTILPAYIREILTDYVAAQHIRFSGDMLDDVDSYLVWGDDAGMPPDTGVGALRVRVCPDGLPPTQ